MHLKWEVYNYNFESTSFRSSNQHQTRLSRKQKKLQTLKRLSMINSIIEQSFH